MRMWVLRGLHALELGAVLLAGKWLGLTWVVRYLRNPNPALTVRVLRAFGARVGEHTTFKRGLLIDNAFEDAHSAGDFRHLVIGRNCYLGDQVYLDLANEIRIEDDAVLAGHVAIVTHADCNRSAVLARIFPRHCAPVVICQGAWLGFRATVLAGVTVGARTVVAAHALLRSDSAPMTLTAGVPAQPIRTLDLEETA